MNQMVTTNQKRIRDVQEIREQNLNTTLQKVIKHIREQKNEKKKQKQRMTKTTRKLYNGNNHISINN